MAVKAPRVVKPPVKPAVKPASKPAPKPSSGDPPKPITPDAPKPNRPGLATAGFAGLTLAGAGASAVPFFMAARDTAAAGIAADTASKAVNTIVDGLTTIVKDITENPMALGAVVACVGVVAFISTRR